MKRLQWESYARAIVKDGKTDWDCNCGVRNDGLRTSCYRCHQSREFSETPLVDAPWQHLATAPKNATWVIGRLKDGSEVRMHYACDISGSEQPAFRGWFRESGIGSSRSFVDVYPNAWRPDDGGRG